MPIVRTLRNHKYQITHEDDNEIRVIDKSTGDHLSFLRVMDKSEEQLINEFPLIPIILLKKTKYYKLNLLIDSSRLNCEVLRIINKDGSSCFLGKISHKNIQEPLFDGPLDVCGFEEALVELYRIRMTLPRHLVADYYGKKLRKAFVITNGKNIKI